MKKRFYFGIVILLILLVSYFINISNFDGVSITNSSLLGILIFYNPFILGLWILIALALIGFGLGRSRKKELRKSYK